MNVALTPETWMEMALEAGVFSHLDVELGRAAVRLAGAESPMVCLLTALTNHDLRNGSVCLVLDELEGRTFDVGDTPLPALPALEEARAELEQHPAVTVAKAAGLGDVELGSAPPSPPTTPLTLAGDRLYLSRYFHDERRLAYRLHQLAKPRVDVPDAGDVRERVQRIFSKGHGSQGSPDWQKVAAAAALRSRLLIVTGGPGTGKTTTVARMLALLVDSAMAAQGKAPRIQVMAPTGKAAQRISESIVEAKEEHISAEESTLEAIPEEATTIHRALGASGGAIPRFRYHADNPLPADIVVVDEASMIDAVMMSRLVDALQEHARLILLGDPDQLASVEAGSVLADICRQRRLFTPAAAEWLGEVAGAALDGRGVELDAQASRIGDANIELRHSHRFTGAIAALARVIVSEVSVEDEARADAAQALLKTGAFPTAEPFAGQLSDLPPDAKPNPLAFVELEPDPDREEEFLRPKQLETLAVEGYTPVLKLLANPLESEDDFPYAEKHKEETPNAFQLFNTFRVLTARRSGVWGAPKWNERIYKRLRSTGAIQSPAEFYPGRPILIRENDYGVNLFNGDIGLVAWVKQPDGTPRPRVFFPSPQGLRALSPSRLPLHTTAFAMTVHKSQGSEFGHVAVLLPPDPTSPLLTRELLYTAVTRAKERVTVVASEAAFRAAVGRRVMRGSGL